jgi:hypothetical protein
MPKAKRTRGGVCPNPMCNTKFFATAKQLNNHISAKRDCSAFVSANRNHHQLKPAPAAPLAGALCFLATQYSGGTTSYCPNVNDVPPPATPPPLPTDDEPRPLTCASPVSFEPPDDHMLPFDLEQSTFAAMQDEDDDDLLLRPQDRSFTTSRRVETTLMKLCTELGAPLHAFQSVMEWAQDARQSDYNWACRQTTYQSQIRSMQNWLGLEHLRPEELIVDLPGAHGINSIRVTVFDFVTQVMSLLSDNELNQAENLVVNPDDPFARYVPSDGKLGECITGSWYNHAWDHMQAMSNNTFLIPIILYIDKTVLGLSGKLSLHPVQMSLGIFTEHARRKSNAWRPLGYIANEEIHYSAAERNENTPDVKNERFHHILDAILHSFKAAQQPNALNNVNLTLGQHTKRVNLYVPLSFIIGDVEGADTLCGRYHYYQEKCPRLCRTCDISTLDAIRTDIRCSRILLADIKHLVDNQDLPALRQLSQRPTFNALFEIDCGDDPHGVFSMIMTEALHALEQGLMPYMMKQLMQQLGSLPVQAELDRLVKSLTELPRQHGYQGFPRVLWKEGVSTLTMLTGDQKVGKMFAVVVLASTRRGEAFFTAHLGGSVQWERMLYCFQQVLSYWAWLKQDTYWDCGDDKARDGARAAIDTMIQQMQNLFPRDDGLGWNLTKMHEQRHVPDDIHRMGAHYNVHSGPQEHNHIENGKNPAKNTQNRKHLLDIQTGHRLVDRLILQKAFDRVVDAAAKPGTALSVPDQGTNLASKAHILLEIPHGSQANSVQATVLWKLSKNANAPLRHQGQILALLATKYFGDHAQDDPDAQRLRIPFFTEYQRNGTVYRAHPDYKGNGAYYDWSNVKWWDGDDADGNPISTNIIGQILGFFTDPGDGEVKAIIHSTLANTQEKHGVFGTFHEMEFVERNQINPLLHVATVDALEAHTMMVPYTVDEKTWIQIWDRAEWSDCFFAVK